jgi:GxxExxY protein
MNYPRIHANEREWEEIRMESELLMKDEVYQVVGAAFAVMNELGSGYLEPVYQESMELELSLRSISFEPQKLIYIQYKGVTLKKYYCADLLCFGKLLVELKVQECLTGREMAQVLNYLKATGIEVAVLINFGPDNKIEWKRIVRSQRVEMFDYDND